MSKWKIADVTVLGCGLMGSALARAMARAGRQVVVWNRSPAKALALAGSGICAVTALSEAAVAAPVVVICVGNYDDVRSTLGSARFAPGVTILNVTSGAPDQAIDLAAWAADQGLEYLDGVIWGYPADIDASAGQIAVSGPARLWQRHADVLGTLAGEVLHLSEDVFTANVFDTAIVGGFYVAAVAALVESVSYIGEYDVSPETAQLVFGAVLQNLAHDAQQAARAIGEQSFGTDQATLGVIAQGARAALQAIQSKGHSARVLGSASAALDLAESAGLGELGIYALQKLSTSAASAIGV